MERAHGLCVPGKPDFELLGTGIMRHGCGFPGGRSPGDNDTSVKQSRFDADRRGTERTPRVVNAKALKKGRCKGNDDTETET